MTAQTKENYNGLKTEAVQVNSFSLLRTLSLLQLRNGISLRRKRHTSKKAPEQLHTFIEQFYSKVIRERKRGTHTMKHMANMKNSVAFCV